MVVQDTLKETLKKAGYQASAEVFANQDRTQYVYDRCSDAEYARRLAKMRAFMAEEGLDLLVIQGGTGTWDRGWLNTRWAVNHVGCQLTTAGYVIVSKTEEPTIFAFPLITWLPARRAREIYEDVRGTAKSEEGVIGRIRELGLERGTIGVIENDLATGIPMRHWEAFTRELPDATFRYVTREWWWKVRLVRSAEEIAFMERAAAIGDKMSEAVEERIRAGMKEQDVFAVLSEAMIANGGEIPTMVLAASGSSFKPFDTFQRERHMNRTLGEGDVIVTELAPRVGDGSECQTGRAYKIGQVSAEYERIAELMLRGYDAVVNQMRPGKTERDVIEAAMFIKEAGYEWLSPLIHGAEGGAAGAQPIIGSAVMQEEMNDPFVFQPNMVVCVEIHIGKPDQSAGLFMADAWVTTEGDPRPLNHYKREFVQL